MPHLVHHHILLLALQAGFAKKLICKFYTKYMIIHRNMLKAKTVPNLKNIDNPILPPSFRLVAYLFRASVGRGGRGEKKCKHSAAAAREKMQVLTHKRSTVFAPSVW